MTKFRWNERSAVNHRIADGVFGRPRRSTVIWGDTSYHPVPETVQSQTMRKAKEAL